MTHKHILVVDDSAAVQEMCRQVLTEGGHHVSVASNGMAALTYPDLDKVDLLIMDTHLRDMSGVDTTRQFKTDSELCEIPVLLLIPESATQENESIELMGANSWLAKPFDPATLLRKVNNILEEQEVVRQSREHLRRAAERSITRMADDHIQKAVEEKTQIMVERALQMVVSQVDIKARREVDTKVNNLTTEKEQELVRVTVQEVARSTVEKLAEKRVTESMERILNAETEKTVRRTADEFFPSLIRERINESMELILPKEVTRRVQKEAEVMVPQVSDRVVTIIKSAAEKIVPKLTREIVKEQAENYVAAELDKHLPRLVQTMVSQEIETAVHQKMAPHLREQAKRLRRRITLFMLLFVAITGGCAVVLTADYMFGPFVPRPASSQVSTGTSGGEQNGTSVGNWFSDMRDRVLLW